METIIMENSQNQSKEPQDKRNSVKKILILSANPKGTHRELFDKEVREIEDGIRRSNRRDKFLIYSKLALQLRDLRRVLLDFEPQIVHFIGHGAEDEDGLIVADEIGSAVSISAEALTGLFELFSGQVECVILNAYNTKALATSISKHIDFVIGMQKEIKEEASIEFTVGFYDALGAGKSVEEAFKFGCNAIQQKFPDLHEHLIPVLEIGEGLKENKKKEMVKITIVIESTNDILDVPVSLDARVSTLKNYLINELPLTITSKDGILVPYKLYSKTRGEVIDEFKTLRENEIEDNESFSLTIKEKIPTVRVIAMLLLLLIPVAIVIIIFPPPLSPPVMVYIPEGKFLMGTSPSEVKQLVNNYGWECEWFSNEKPQREIDIQAFYISKYEITNKQYREFLKDNPDHIKPAYLTEKNFNAPDQPVVGVSWKDAAAFCDWLSRKTNKRYRLPTEAEWEKAARGMDGRLFPWGNEEPNINKANFMNQHHKTVSVKEKAEGASAFGLMNMAGNVWEWCNDWYILDREKVVRGGCWQDNAFFLRCSARHKYPPDIKNEVIGFRIVRLKEN
ncbi:MAG: SUMF1/EgtB/PvdO family nonheme iron enzyme [Candidatus Aminicenantes bacterium]|jgi:formylglycine-generating enzyme required for sulfatase activity